MYALIDPTIYFLTPSVSSKSSNLIGLMDAASENSVLALSQWENSFLVAWNSMDSTATSSTFSTNFSRLDALAISAPSGILKMNSPKLISSSMNSSIPWYNFGSSLWRNRTPSPSAASFSSRFFDCSRIGRYLWPPWACLTSSRPAVSRSPPWLGNLPSVKTPMMFLEYLSMMPLAVSMSEASRIFARALSLRSFSWRFPPSPISLVVCRTN